MGGKSSEGQESYGRMRRETESQGWGRRKPLRGRETLRAEGTGEANRYATIAQAERRRKENEPQGRCHQRSGCVKSSRHSSLVHGFGRRESGITTTSRDLSIRLRLDQRVTRNRPRLVSYRVRSPSLQRRRFRPAQTPTEEGQGRSMASCCGNTLKWNRRAGEAARQNGNILEGKPCGRNTSRSGSRKLGTNDAEGELNPYGSTTTRRLRSSGKPHERNRSSW